MLGSTGSITITKEDTIILNGEGSKDAIEARCEQIRSLLVDPTTSEFDKTKLQERLAKLSGGVAVIKVGGSSEVEVGGATIWDTSNTPLPVSLNNDLSFSTLYENEANFPESNHINITQNQ